MGKILLCLHVYFFSVTWGPFFFQSFSTWSISEKGTLIFVTFLNRLLKLLCLIMLEFFRDRITIQMLFKIFKHSSYIIYRYICFQLEINTLPANLIQSVVLFDCFISLWCHFLRFEKHLETLSLRKFKLF